jgi:hypothetical protein
MAMEEDDTDDQRLLHSLGVTSASIDDIERKILSQASRAGELVLALIVTRRVLSSHDRVTFCFAGANRSEAA